MKRTELICVAILAIALGTGMHFMHHAPFFNDFLGCIFPVRESVWEHMKMFLYPLLLLSLYEALRQKDFRALAGPVFVTPLAWVLQISIFCIYWLPVGHEITLIDIIEFIVVMALAVWLGDRWSRKESVRRLWPWAIVLAVLMIVALGVLTYCYPDWLLFRDFGD